MLRIKAVWLLCLLASIMMLAGAFPAMAHDASVGTNENPFLMDSMSAESWDHYDMEPFAGYFILTVQNDTGIDWGDFHFEINNPDVIIESASSTLNFLAGPDATINSDATGSRADFKFYDAPLLAGQIATFSILTNNTNSLDLFTISAYPTPVPAPAALWLLGSGLFGLAGIRRKRAA